MRRGNGDGMPYSGKSDFPLSGMNIVFASHSPYDGCLVIGSHQLARELTAAGHTAWCIGPPITPLHFAMAFRGNYGDRVKKAWKSPYQLPNGVTIMEPMTVVPWQIAKWKLDSGNLFVQLSNIKSTLAKPEGLSTIDVLLVDDPRYVGIELQLKPRSVFYRPTDLYAEMKGDPMLTAAERILLTRCDGVIATSRPVLDHVMSLRPKLPYLLLENGVDYRHFSEPREEPDELKAIPHPRIIYVGALDFRFDTEMLAVMAQNLPQASFIVIGPGEKYDAVKALGRPNIHVLGPKPYHSIPGFLQHSDIGILPLLNTTANSGRSPMKLYEYGAAGLPVVARHTPELKRRGDSFIQLFSTGEEAVDALRATLKNPTDRHAIAVTCLGQSWVTKASTLLHFVESNMKPGFEGSPSP
jgi:glycosyltransferase involved in cell wall biosynthesis